MKGTRILWAGGLTFFLATSTYAHGPQVKVDPGSLAAGNTITVRGQGITSKGSIHLRLQGILRDYDLGTATGDEHGRFEIQVPLPADLEPGEYTLIASGEKTATTRLTVTALPQEGPAPGEGEEQTAAGAPAGGHREGGTMAHGEEGHEHAHGGEAGTAEARDEPMDLKRSASVMETVLAWAIVLVSAALGMIFLVRGRSGA